MTTQAGLRQSISRALKDLVVLGTATGGTTTTLIDTTNLIHADTDQLKGYQLYIYGGTAIGQTRFITAFTPATDTVTFAAGTAPDTTSTYEIHRRFTVAEYNAAIDAAHNAARYRMLLDKFDESIILNNILSNGLFATWTSSSACTGWTKDANSTLARESSIIYARTYSAKLTTDGTNIGSLSQSVSNYPAHAGEDLTLRGWLFTSTASRVRIRLADGVNTWNSDYHDTKGWGGDDGTYLELADKSISDAATELTASVQVSSGTAVNVYVGRMELQGGKRGLLPSSVYDYAIPSGFVGLYDVQMEDGEHNKFYSLDNLDWDIRGEGTRQLYIPSPRSGRAIRLCGQAKATLPTADTSTIELNEEFITAYACWRLLLGKENKTAEDFTALQWWKREAESLIRAKTVGFNPGTKHIEPI